MICPKCATELPEEASFCPYCMEKFIKQDNKIIITKKKYPKTMLIGIILGICVLFIVFTIAIIGTKPNTTSDGNNSTENMNINNNTTEEYNFVEKTDNIDWQRRFNATLDQFINCYNAYQTEEYGNYALKLNKSDLQVMSNNEKITEYLFISPWTAKTTFTIFIENNTQKICGIEYRFDGSVTLTDKSLAYCCKVLSWGTNNYLTSQEILKNYERITNKEGKFNDKWGYTLLDKGIMWMYLEQTHSTSSASRVVFALLPMSKQYYTDVVCGNKQIASNTTTDETPPKDESDSDENVGLPEQNNSQNQGSLPTESETQNETNKIENEKENLNTIALNAFTDYNNAIQPEAQNEYRVKFDDEVFNMNISNWTTYTSEMFNSSMWYQDNVVVTTDFEVDPYGRYHINIYAFNEYFAHNRVMNEDAHYVTIELKCASNDKYKYDVENTKELYNFVITMAQKMLSMHPITANS